MAPMKYVHIGGGIALMNDAIYIVGGKGFHTIERYGIRIGDQCQFIYIGL
jgi:hypothetical protein